MPNYISNITIAWNLTYNRPLNSQLPIVSRPLPQIIITVPSHNNAISCRNWERTHIFSSAITSSSRSTRQLNYTQELFKQSKNFKGRVSSNLAKRTWALYVIMTRMRAEFKSGRESFELSMHLSILWHTGHADRSKLNLYLRPIVSNPTLTIRSHCPYHPKHSSQL